MTALTWERLMRELEMERRAPKPAPYRNPVRRYDSELEQECNDKEGSEK